MIRFRLSSRIAYCRLISTHNYDYYITDRGYVIAIHSNLTEKEMIRELAIAKPLPIYLKAIKSKPYLLAYTNIKTDKSYIEIMLKQAVIECFTRCKIKYSFQIQHLNEDVTNCKLNNLIVYSVDEAKKFRKGHEVIIHFKDGRIETYSNISAAAKALFVSRNALINFKDGIANNSCLANLITKIE